MKIIGNNPAAENAEITAVASGTLPSGQPVIVNADGTVSVVAGSSASFDQEVGTPTTFFTGMKKVSATYDANAQKVVLAFINSSTDYGTAIVGTVSGNSISFGTPVVFESAIVDDPSITYDANAQKVVIAYADQGNGRYGTAIVGTVSGTNISFGTAAVFENANISYTNITYDSDTQKVVMSYTDSGNSSYGTAVVGTVSGTNISFGTPVVFESGNSNHFSSAYDTNAQRVVIAYKDDGNSSRGTAVVGTVSGTAISFGSPVIFNSSGSSNNSAVYDSAAQKVVIAYRDQTNSDGGTAIVGTVSGTSISFGTEVIFETGATEWISIAYDTGAKKVVVVYKDDTNFGHGTLCVGTVSGTSISFGTPVVFESANTVYTAATYDANAGKVVAAYQDADNSSYGTAVVFQNAYTSLTTNLTSENFIGFANGAAADTGKAKVDIGCSINDAQSGLTAGQTYYVQGDGTLGLTAADPSVIAGTAISATEIIVKG